VQRDTCSRLLRILVPEQADALLDGGEVFRQEETSGDG
jgi:hypothetical protein